MCLLITQNAEAPVLSNEWLEDFYDYNSDGVGVMRSENGRLIVEKVLPKTAKEFIQFYHDHIAGKDCAFHLRMRTHGEIDLDNCHPYPVLNFAEHGIDLWLMHNGILHTDNKADLSKSDTYHYIKNYLVPMLAKNPDFAFTDAFSELISEHIGSSNKFVLMDSHNRMTTINKDAGVYWAGLWLSNTYAWTASQTASKKPLTSIKKARKQAKEKPVLVRPFKSNYSYSAYPNYYDRDPDWMSEVRPVQHSSALDYDLEMMLDTFHDEGYFEASNITMTQVYRFVDAFSESSFFDIGYMLIDKRIDEHWFIQIMHDFELAKESFAWLEDKELV